MALEIPAAICGHTLDTCTIVNIWRDVNNATMIGMYFEKHLPVYVNSCVRRELLKNYHKEVEVGEMLRSRIAEYAAANGVAADMIECTKSMLRKHFGKHVEWEDITSEMKEYAERLEGRYPGLHYPDNIILAFAIHKNTMLITYDTDLLDVARKMKVPCDNPGTMAGDCSSKKAVIKYDHTVRREHSDRF